MACGDDDNGGGDDATPATTPVAGITQGPPGIVEGNTYISTALNYRVEFPDGWRVDEAFFVDPATRLDAFFAGEQVNGVEPNIQVRCDRLEAQGLTPQAFVDARSQAARAFAFRDVAESPVAIAGNQGRRFEYQQMAGETLVDKTEVAFAAGACGWTLALTRAAGDGQHSQGFDRMLASFALTEGGS